MSGRRVKVVKWFNPKTVDTGWSKSLPVKERRELMLEAHGGDYLSAARALLALHNVTKDKTTKIAAFADAKYFFKLHERSK